LNYATNTLTSPFTPPTGYGTWTFLASVANNIPLTTSFTYSSAGSGELTQVTFPYLGHLRWGYGPSSYSGTRTLREVNAGRFLSTASGAPETTYAPWYSGDPSLTFHSYSGLNDPDGLSQKAWSFGTDNTKASYALMSYLEKRPHQSGSTAGETAVTPTWTTDTAGNPYMSAVYTIEDNFNPTAIAKQTSQTIDRSK
jgi:hypothetical protein